MEASLGQVTFPRPHKEEVVERIPEITSVWNKGRIPPILPPPFTGAGLWKTVGLALIGVRQVRETGVSGRAWSPWDTWEPVHLLNGTAALTQVLTKEFEPSVSWSSDFLLHNVKKLEIYVILWFYKVLVAYQNFQKTLGRPFWKTWPQAWCLWSIVFWHKGFTYESCPICPFKYSENFPNRT